jgi:glycosyltransferase involved in cell wall biosynthesis
MGLKLRIGMVTHYMPPHIGGIEICADQLFRSYKEAGHEVHWVASRVPPQTPRQENGLVRVGCWNWLERGLGVPWPVWGPASLTPLMAMIKWADILHIHDCLYYSSALTLALARRLNKPVLLSQHIGAVTYRSAVLNGLASLAYQTLGCAVLRGAAHVVFCTPAAEDFCLGLAGRSLKAFSSIPVGVDIERFHPPSPEERYRARLNLGLPEGGPVVLFVGRLQEKKGAGEFQEVAEGNSGKHFLIIGDGPLRPPVKKNLTWLPRVPPESMAPVYHAADVFLLPSLSEGLPLSMLEAMASGVPVIVSRHLPIGGILEKEGAGWTAECTSGEFAATLTKVFEAPETAVSLAHRARRLVELRWSSKAMAKKYLSLIQQITRRFSPGDNSFSDDGQHIRD